jgi:hypothetical protein
MSLAKARPPPNQRRQRMAGFPVDGNGAVVCALPYCCDAWRRFGSEQRGEE